MRLTHTNDKTLSDRPWLSCHATVGYEEKVTCADLRHAAIASTSAARIDRQKIRAATMEGSKKTP